MNHIQEFCRFAKNYDAVSLIQKEVAKELVNKITDAPQKILDLGCGSGAICRELLDDYELFVGVDNALAMCELHPKSDHIMLIHNDFECEDFFLHVKNYAPFDLIISASALQWSKDLEKVLQRCKQLSSRILFAIFSDGTFASINQHAGLKSFLPSSDALTSLISRYFNVAVSIKKYKLFFEDNISKFRYIKRSGISGGVKRLSVAQTKDLIKNYPHEYLEFEVCFFTCKENLSSSTILL
ncbi:MAG: methyltransferase domain-containing protein [Sulfurospirillum sp.]|nr:methyltransferase domain-containing protein [Sulfurospirillum sp.]